MLSLAFLAMAAVQLLPDELPLPDAVLAEQRGGFRLPGGLDVDLAVRTQTAIDGRVVLATVFTIADGRTSFIPYVPGAGEQVLIKPVANSAASSAERPTPTATFDFRNGITVVPGQAAAPGIAINGDQSAGSPPEGLVEASPGAIDGGTLSSASNSALHRIELRGEDVSITHLAGSAFGSAIANSGSDRTIDTTTSVGIDLRNAGPDNLGSTFLRVGDLAADGIARRIN